MIISITPRNGTTRRILVTDSDVSILPPDGTMNEPEDIGLIKKIMTECGIERDDITGICKSLLKYDWSHNRIAKAVGVDCGAIIKAAQDDHVFPYVKKAFEKHFNPKNK